MKESIKIRDTEITVAQILGQIAEGRSYHQILQANPTLTMGDIMASAELARQVIEQLEDENGKVDFGYAIKFIFSQGEFVSLDKLRETHPRAYQPWSPREENQLAEMFKRGVTINDMVAQLGRQPGAIRSRLEKLELVRR